jgi:signal recognition particle receptor subunit beta
VDAVVFVADSLTVQRELNLISLKNLQDNLALHKKDIYQIPLVIQYNKRDLEKQGIPVMPLEMMENDLNGKLKVPSIPASAIIGDNVVMTLKKIISMTLISFQKGF